MWKTRMKNKSIVSFITLITYLSDISSMNLRQIWVFPIPPNPQRRQERLNIRLLVARGEKIFPSCLSTLFRPVKNRLESGFCGTKIFTFPLLAGSVWAGTILIYHTKYVCSIVYTVYERLTKLPPVTSTFWAFEKNPEFDCWVYWLSAKAKRHGRKQLTEGSDSNPLYSMCCNRGNALRLSSAQAISSIAKVETKAETPGWAVWSMTMFE